MCLNILVPQSWSGDTQTRKLRLERKKGPGTQASHKILESFLKCSGIAYRNNVWGWGDYSADKSACGVSLKTGVLIPNTYDSFFKGQG